jgi:hypothetical protein
MNKTESMALSDSQSEEAIVLRFDPKTEEISSANEDDEDNEDIVAIILEKMLSEQNQTFVLELARKHQTHPMEVVNAAIESYELFVKIIESGGSLQFIDQFGRLHPIADSQEPQPPAA